MLLASGACYDVFGGLVLAAGGQAKDIYLFVALSALRLRGLGWGLGRLERGGFCEWIPESNGCFLLCVVCFFVLVCTFPLLSLPCFLIPRRQAGHEQFQIHFHSCNRRSKLSKASNIDSRLSLLSPCSILNLSLILPRGHKGTQLPKPPAATPPGTIPLETRTCAGNTDRSPHSTRPTEQGSVFGSVSAGA